MHNQEDLIDKIYFKQGKIRIGVHTLHFKEGDYFIAYIPSLDLSGYGSTYDEAQKSVDVAVGEFFDYAIKKKTLDSELIRLGWIKENKSRKKPKYFAPDLEELKKNTPYLENMVMNKQNMQQKCYAY